MYEVQVLVATVRLLTSQQSEQVHVSRALHPKHPARPHGIPGKDSYSSHDPGLAPQPSHGTTSVPAKQQALKTKMDI
jgi:hypothetical protein